MSFNGGIEHEPILMINDRVENLDALLEVLTSEGVEIDPRRDDSEYDRFGWIIDPEDNLIKLWEPPRGQQARNIG